MKKILILMMIIILSSPIYAQIEKQPEKIEQCLTIEEITEILDDRYAKIVPENGENIYLGGFTLPYTTLFTNEIWVGNLLYTRFGIDFIRTVGDTLDLINTQKIRLDGYECYPSNGTMKCDGI